MKATDLNCGFAHEFALTAAKAGWEIADIDILAKSEDTCREVLQVLRGFATVVPIEHIIDCDVAPFCPNNWEVLPPEEQIPSRFRGKLKWDKAGQAKALYLSPEQKGSKWIVGNNLRTELTEKLVVVLPANVIDYCLAHPHLIPEEWKGKAVFFWGTIYRSSDGNLYVRYLVWYGGAWRSDFSWLDNYFNSNNPAALLASQPSAL